MSLIFVVDRLDEVHLQDRLVRCVLNLQSDTEASIRTNTIIFIGKIAHKLKEAVQQRVLCNALIKAMKDPFLHCRLAAIKTALATIKLIDIPQIAGKLMPQCSVMLLDKHPDVRGMSITLLETCVETMKKYHAQMIEQQQAAAAAGKQQQQQQGDQIGQGESGDYLGSSWNVLQNLVSPTAVRSTSSGSLSKRLAGSRPFPWMLTLVVLILIEPSTGGSNTGLSTYNVPPSPSAAAQPPAPQMTSSGKLLPKSAIQVDDDWDDMDTGNPLPSSKSTSMLDQDDTTSTGRWGDELDALDLDDMDLGHSAESLNTSKPSKPPVSVPVSPPSFETPDKKKPLPKAKPKVAVKKLQVDNDEKWDDF